MNTARLLHVLLCFSLWLLTTGVLFAAVERPAEPSNSLEQAVQFFQNYVSPVDGPRCQMEPTCSTYARQALRKHGVWMGMFITVDRLMREVDPLERQQPVLKNGVRRYLDPLDANDGWLHPSAPLDPSLNPGEP